MITLVPVIFKNWEMMSGQTRNSSKQYGFIMLSSIYPTEVQQAFQPEHTPKTISFVEPSILRKRHVGM